MTDLVFTDKDNGALVEVSLGCKLTVELPENPTAGYQWAIDSVDEVFLVPEGDAFLVGKQMGLGTGGVRRFFFRAKGFGCTSLGLINKCPSPSDQPSIASFKLVVRILK